MSDFINLFAWYGTQLGGVFLMFDNVQVMDSGFTILDFMLAPMFLSLVVWFIKRLKGDDAEEDEEDESTQIWDRILSRGQV